MSMRYRRFQVASLGLAAVVASLLLARLLVTPATGDVLILASARQADHVQAGTVELHGRSGWLRLGTFSAGSVPAAPQTSTLVSAQAPVGTYDQVRIAGKKYVAPLTVQRTLLATVLVAVEEGLPADSGFYAGSQDVSLGLNELSGQMKSMPDFSLMDQFARPFSRSTLLGHVAVVAAFRTTCRTVCPLYTGLFFQLRRLLPPSVYLLEVTSDPSIDTPDVLRAYAGRTGASWTFLTGDGAALTAFWTPFDVELGHGDIHRSTLALVDSHGYIRSYYLGAPDVGGNLPEELASLLDPEGQTLLRTHASSWGAPQVVDALGAIGGLAQPGSAGQGQAPDFSLNALDGGRVSLSQWRGRPVVINFWASWCVPCRRELPLLEREAEAHPRLILLLVDERDQRAPAVALANDLGITSTILFDPDGTVGDLYQVAGLPTTVFVRPDESMEGRYLGETNEQILGPHVSAIGA